MNDDMSIEQREAYIVENMKIECVLAQRTIIAHQNANGNYATFHRLHSQHTDVTEFLTNELLKIKLENKNTTPVAQAHAIAIANVRKGLMI